MRARLIHVAMYQLCTIRARGAVLAAEGITVLFPVPVTPTRTLGDGGDHRWGVCKERHARSCSARYHCYRRVARGVPPAVFAAQNDDNFAEFSERSELRNLVIVIPDSEYASRAMLSREGGAWPARTAVLSAAMGYKLLRFVTFVVPLRLHYDGDIILLLGRNTSQDVLSLCAQQRVTMQYITNISAVCHSYATLNSGAQCPGFALSRFTLLAESCRGYDLCFSIDFRDVVNFATHAVLWGGST